MRILIESRKDAFTLTAKTYSLGYNAREPEFVRLSAGEWSQKLCIWSACDGIHEKDALVRIVRTPQYQEIPRGHRILFEGISLLHKKKVFIFDCYEDYLEYYYKFVPALPIDRLYFFQGWGLPGVFAPMGKGEVEPQGETVSGALQIREISASKAFAWLFNPEPNALDRQWVSAQEYGKVSVNYDFNFNGGNAFFTPGLIAFAVTDQNGSVWMSMGIAAHPGDYNFNDYEFAAGRILALSLTYFGKTKPSGSFTTPHLVIHFGASEREALNSYVDFLLANQLVPGRTAPDAPWWREPIFCGWGEQAYQADFHNRLGEKDMKQEWNPFQYSNQAFYEHMADILEKNKIPFRTLIIDDKWQKERGLPKADEGKWPDIRGFIDRLHKKGKKVVLWWGLFTGEGVPSRMCITKGEQKLCEDPTNPELVKELRKAVKRMLSDKEGCYNADGFKIDFTAATPADYEARRVGVPWGIELLKTYLREIYATAKKIKKDAFIITHAANPYFMDVCDAIRLNDIDKNYQDSVVKKMEFRAGMARLACPGLLIDTDNWPCPSRKAWLEYMRLQPSLGIPSLYYATHIDTTREAIQPKDWTMISKLWKDYTGKTTLHR